MKTVQQMKDEKLREFGNPVDGIRKGGMIARLTMLGWSDLYAEDALEHYAEDHQIQEEAGILERNTGLG